MVKPPFDRLRAPIHGVSMGCRRSRMRRSRSLPMISTATSPMSRAPWRASARAWVERISAASSFFFSRGTPVVTPSINRSPSTARSPRRRGASEAFDSWSVGHISASAVSAGRQARVQRSMAGTMQRSSGWHRAAGVGAEDAEPYWRRKRGIWVLVEQLGADPRLTLSDGPARQVHCQHLEVLAQHGSSFSVAGAAAAPSRPLSPCRSWSWLFKKLEELLHHTDTLFVAVVQDRRLLLLPASRGRIADRAVATPPPPPARHRSSHRTSYRRRRLPNIARSRSCSSVLTPAGTADAILRARRPSGQPSPRPACSSELPQPRRCRRCPQRVRGGSAPRAAFFDAATTTIESWRF